MQKVLFLIRGSSGSGKTTYANQLLQAFTDIGMKVKHFEADQYFMKDGNYHFNPSKLTEVHKKCFDNTRSALDDEETNVVIVSNTFIKKWEIEPYLKLVEERKNVAVKILRMLAQFQNQHGVPLEKIEKQRKNMEDIENEEYV